MNILLIVDFLLAGIVVILAYLCLFSRTDYQAVIFFSLVGVAAALIWARLGAPDVALAEAAIGAGLTGALFFAHLKASPRKS